LRRSGQAADARSATEERSARRPATRGGACAPGRLGEFGLAKSYADLRTIQRSGARRAPRFGDEGAPSQSEQARRRAETSGPPKTWRSMAPNRQIARRKWRNHNNMGAAPKAANPLAIFGHGLAAFGGLWTAPGASNALGQSRTLALAPGSPPEHVARPLDAKRIEQFVARAGPFSVKCRLQERPHA
jgi:hypothetical protein